MARLIDVDSAVKAISRLAEDMSINDRAVALLLALELNNEDRFPAADVVPVKHGHWIQEGEPPMFSLTCSVCGQKFFNHYLQPHANYCSMCGALMDEVTE